MMAERYSLWTGHSRAFILVVTIFLCSGYAFAAEQTGALRRTPAQHPSRDYGTEPVRYRIFSLTNISAEQGKEYLAKAKIGTVSKFPDSNTLLVTAGLSELIKATAILTLVDVSEQFAVRTILPAAGLEDLPSNRQIAAKVGNISIGTFSNLPIGPAVARAIVDIHNNAVVVVAPVSQIKRIVAAVEKSPILQEVPEAVTWQPTGPDEPHTTMVPGEVVERKQVTAERYTPAPIPNGDETLKLSLPEKLTIPDLLSLVGEYYHLDFMYDPVQIKGEVTLKLQGKLRGNLRVKDLYPLLESALKFRGFVMTRKGNLVIIRPAANALDIDPVLLVEDGGRVEHGDVIVTRVFQLKYIDTASAQNFLTAMKLTTTVTPVPETGTLVVTDYTYRMPRIEELLKIIDKPGEPKEFRFRQLKFTMAKTLATKVKTLAEQLGTVSITITAASPAPPRGRETPAQRRAREAAARTAAARAPAAKPAVYLDADERTNRILMIGIAEQLDVVDALIDTLDVQQQDLRTMKLYKIEHVDAEEARKKLGELGIIGTGGRAATPSRITTPAKAGTPPTARPPATRTTGTAAEGLVEEPQIVVIEMTNSLLVNATAEQHAQIARILTYVDSRTEEEEIPYKVYPLENQRPEDLATVLNQLIEKTIKDKEGKIQQVVKKTAEDITIIPDENTFSLIVYASKKNQEWIASLIKQLDKRRPQVLIDVLLVEITRDDEFEYDLNLIANAKRSVTGNIAVTGTLPNKTGLHRHNLEAGWNLDTAKAFVQGFYSVNKIQALLTTMAKKGYGRILAQPKVLVNDNEEGLIKTTEKTHVGEETQSWPGEGTTPVTTIKWTPYEAKIELSITPNISEGDLLRLEINMLREDFEKKENAPPDYTTSNINTIVTVPDGSTIILGGLTKLKQKKGGSKVPLLGDIPIVGGLFRTVANSDESSKLYIFVKANILRPDETVGLAQLQQISAKSKAAFEKAERKFQEYEDWPGIKPKPIDPLRVLEAE